MLLRVRSLPHLALRGHLVRRRVIGRHLAVTAAPKLQIGTGPQVLAGWLNSDIVGGDAYIDLCRRLPFTDRTFAFVYGEHIIEHVGRATAHDTLREFHRILRPGGVLRLVTPDLAKLVALYQCTNPMASTEQYIDRLGEITHHRPQNGCQVVNDLMRLFGHRHIYDQEDLTTLLEVGFSSVEGRDFGQSSHPELRGVEQHVPAWENSAVALCIEATR